MPFVASSTAPLKSWTPGVDESLEFIDTHHVQMRQPRQDEPWLFARRDASGSHRVSNSLYFIKFP